MLVINAGQPSEGHLGPFLQEVNNAGEPLVTLDRRGSTGVVTLNRLERSNAWDEALEVQFYRAIDACAADADVRVVIVHGAGRHFSPGMDKARLVDVVQGRPYALTTRRPTILRDLPKPVIAAIDGACAGVGLLHALMSDIRVATQRSTWSTAFTRIGLVAEDGLARRLRDLVGLGAATELLLTSRRIAGPEAVRLGLATAIVPDDELLARALEMAQQVAAGSPSSMALTKWQLNRADNQSLDEAAELASRCLRVAKARPDYREGVTALVERRPPLFPGIDSTVWDTLLESVAMEGQVHE